MANEHLHIKLSSKKQQKGKSKTTIAESRELDIAMFPWFAFGHMIPFFHLSNELAERGHKIGSENIMVQNQFQELLLGLELTPYRPTILSSSKTTVGSRNRGRGLPGGIPREGRREGSGPWRVGPSADNIETPVGWVFSEPRRAWSMWESLTTDPQIVLLPEYADHIFTARLLADELKVAVEVEKEENGLFSKERLCETIKPVMDEESEIGGLVKKNHAKWKDTLISPGFISNYIDNFVGQLQDLLDQK